MPITRVLIAVKTYPTLSEKYDELVCTAGFLEDGTWIRIYPIPFRKLSYDNRYNKCFSSFNVSLNVWMASLNLVLTVPSGISNSSDISCCV